MDKITLLRFLDGHKKANQFITSEKKKRLSQLSVKDSLLEYDALCKMWESNPNKRGMEELKQQKISFLVEMRRTFNKLNIVRWD